MMNDWDCDGIDMMVDCDDNDSSITSTMTSDWDCDGIETAYDCNDTDPTSTTIATDGDCDGIATADDCDDTDIGSNAIADDADCDVAIGDCDDSNTALIQLMKIMMDTAPAQAVLVILIVMIQILI